MHKTEAMLLVCLGLGIAAAATAETKFDATSAPKAETEVEQVMPKAPPAAEVGDEAVETQNGGVAGPRPNGGGVVPPAGRAAPGIAAGDGGCVRPPPRRPDPKGPAAPPGRPDPEGPAPRPPPGSEQPEPAQEPHSSVQTTIDAAAHARAVKEHAEFLSAAAAPTGEPARKTTIQVPSRSGAQPASLTVAAGEILRFETRSGKWSVDERTIPLSGPDGHLESLALHKNWGDRREVGTLPFGRLLARVGRGPWVDAGSDKAVRFLDSGDLLLRINDNDGSLADNAGTLEVEVRVHEAGKRSPRQ